MGKSFVIILLDIKPALVLMLYEYAQPVQAYVYVSRLAGRQRRLRRRLCLLRASRKKEIRG